MIQVPQSQATSRSVKSLLKDEIRAAVDRHVAECPSDDRHEIEKAIVSGIVIASTFLAEVDGSAYYTPAVLSAAAAEVRREVMANCDF